MPDPSLSVGPGYSSERWRAQEYKEREGLEPAGGPNRISNLLIPLELLSPALPLDPQIWHSIWHWADAAPSRCSCNRHVEAELALTD